MAGLNKVIIMGNLGRDPEIRSLKNGDRIASISIATSESWRDKQSGERKEKTEWHKVTIWGQMVDIVEKYVSKGDQILIEGKLETRKWQAQDGTDRFSTEIQVKPFGGQITLVGGRKNGNGGYPGGRSSGANDDYGDAYQGGGSRPSSGRGSELEPEGR